MKTLEQVKNYLKVEGMNEKDIHKVIGFLYAECDFVLGTPLRYKVARNTFLNFVNWYEEENDVFDELLEKKKNIQDLWSGLHVCVSDVKSKFNDETFDLCEQMHMIDHCKVFLESIEHILGEMQEILEAAKDEKEKEVK